MGVVGKLMKFCLFIVIFAVLILALQSVYSMVTLKLYPGEAAGILGYKPLTVFSDSMKPVLKPGDLAVFKETDIRSISKGDIIAYSLSGSDFIAERVTEIKNNSGKIALATQGDANNALQSNPVSSDKLVGKLSFNIPFAGFIVCFWSSAPGIILLILVPAICFINLYRKAQKRKLVIGRRQRLKEKVLGG